MAIWSDRDGNWGGRGQVCALWIKLRFGSSGRISGLLPVICCIFCSSDMAETSSFARRIATASLASVSDNSLPCRYYDSTKLSPDQIQELKRILSDKEK